MYIVIFTSLLALLLTHLNSKDHMRNGMSIGFILVTLLAVIHYNYGNDYMEYYKTYNEINKYSVEDLNILLDQTYFRDSGWTLICLLFNNLGGFFMMVAVLNIIQNLVVYRFIKNNVSKQWWTMAVFIYLFATNLYLLNFSMMRQGLIVCLFLGMWKYIKERKWWWPLLVLYLCTYIHGSAIILLPFAFWGYLPMKNGKVWACIFLAVFAILWSQKDILGEIIFMATMTSESLEDYTTTYGDNVNTATFNIGFIMNLIPFILSLFYSYKCDNPENRKLVLLAAISFMVTPFTLIIPDIGRLGTYFAVYKLASYPVIYSSIKRTELKIGFIAIFILMTVYDYWLFFNIGVFAKPYSTFHTIFEAL